MLGTLVAPSSGVLAIFIETRFINIKKKGGLTAGKDLAAAWRSN
jgi:hypothetical protein